MFVSASCATRYTAAARSGAISNSSRLAWKSTSIPLRSRKPAHQPLERGDEAGIEHSGPQRVLNPVTGDNGGLEQLRDRIELRPYASVGQGAREPDQFKFQRSQRTADIVVNLLRDRAPLLFLRAFKMLCQRVQFAFALRQRRDRSARIAPGIRGLQGCAAAPRRYETCAF